jgi:hypothetical protein
VRADVTHACILPSSTSPNFHDCRCRFCHVNADMRECAPPLIAQPEDRWINDLVPAQKKVYIVDDDEVIGTASLEHLLKAPAPPRNGTATKGRWGWSMVMIATTLRSRCRRRKSCRQQIFACRPIPPAAGEEPDADERTMGVVDGDDHHDASKLLDLNREKYRCWTSTPTLSAAPLS